MRKLEGWALSRMFTLEEARELVGELGGLLEQARETATRASELEGEMQELSQRIFLSGGLHVDVPAAARRRAEREKSVSDTRATIEEIEKSGARVAENGGGGLEFPCLHEGREVVLCWTLGDETITQWRETEDEADVRREIDGRFSGWDGGRLN